MVDNEVINPNCSINIYGYVEDWRGLSSEDGKKYNFHITDIAIEDIYEELELLYDEYICDFDTVKEGLKFVIEKIEIKQEKIMIQKIQQQKYQIKNRKEIKYG